MLYLTLLISCLAAASIDAVAQDDPGTMKASIQAYEVLVDHAQYFTPHHAVTSETNSESNGVEFLENIRQQLYDAAGGDEKAVALGIVRFMTSRTFQAKLHPMTVHLFLAKPEELWGVTDDLLSKAIIDLAPYSDTKSTDWAAGLFLFRYTLQEQSPEPSVYLPQIVSWLSIVGLDQSHKSAFVIFSAFEAPVFRKLDVLEALLDYTGTAKEVLDEWGVASVEEVKLPTTPAMMNRYLCSENLWARLFGLNYARNRSTSIELLQDEPCLEPEAEHPLEARWAAELMAKLEGEAVKESEGEHANAEVDAAAD